MVMPSRSEDDRAPAYAWVVAGVSAAVNSLAWSVRSTFALFYVALLGEFGWDRGEAALGYSLSWLLLLVFSPLAGWLYDRWGARRVVAGGGVILGGALALTGQVTSLLGYYLAFGVLGAAGISFIMMPAAAVVTRWFTRTRGAALGLISAGSSASAIVFYPINTWLIQAFGWRAAIVVYGVVVAALTVPLALLLYREQPEGVTRQPVLDPTITVADGWTLAAALRSYRFWAVFAMWCLGVIGYQIMTTHQVAHAIEKGFDAVTIAWVFALAGAATVAGNLLGGALSDRWGSEGVFALGSAIGIAGIAALASLHGPDDFVLLVVYAVAGLGFGMRISLLTTIPAAIFAGPHIGAILGAANGGGGLGGLIGPFLGGLIFDVTGSYRLAFVGAAVAIAGSALAAWIAAPRRSQRMVR